MGSTIQWCFCVSRTRLIMSESFLSVSSIRLITSLFSMEGAEQVEDTVKELFYEKLFPIQSAFERGSEWDLANPTMDEEVVITEEVTTTTKQEKTTYPTQPPQTVQLIDLPDDEELFYACAKYIGFLTLSCLFITKFICTKNSTLRRVRLL